VHNIALTKLIYRMKFYNAIKEKLHLLMKNNKIAGVYTFSARSL